MHKMDIEGSVLSDMLRYGVEVRTFHWETEIKNTVIAKDSFYGTFVPHVANIYMANARAYSDLVRILVCGNYGGMWLDTDAWLMKPADDIFRSSEKFLPSGESFNNHVLYLKKKSPLVQRFNDALLLFRYDPHATKINGTSIGLHKAPLYSDEKTWPRMPVTGLHHWVYNDAMSQYVYDPQSMCTIPLYHGI